MEYSVDDAEDLNGSNQDGSARIQTLNFKLTDCLASPSPDRNGAINFATSSKDLSPN